jgi:ABC-type transport system substrate-binding protein
MRQVVTAMRQIGYHPRLKIYDGKEEYFTYIGDSRHRVQAAFFGWVADDFSASDFFVGLFDCKSFKPASSLNNNPAEFCDPSIDQLMNRAVRVQSTSLAKADPLWAKVDRRVTDAAPFVPLVTPTWVDVVSKRVHNYQRSPVIGVLYDQMWVH